MKATNLYYQFKGEVGYTSKNSNRGRTFNLCYDRFWNTGAEEEEEYKSKTSKVTEQWNVIAHQREKWKSDVKHFYPDNEITFKLFLGRMYAYGIGDVLDKVCDINKEDKCVIFSYGFVILSQNPKDCQPMMHVDFPSVFQKVHTVLIPLELPTSIEPELLLTSIPIKRLDKRKTYKYRYSKNVALIFNGGVEHGTNRSGSTGDPRIMLILFVGSIDESNSLINTSDIIKLTYGYPKQTINSVKQALDWQRKMAHHKKTKSYFDSDVDYNFEYMKAKK